MIHSQTGRVERREPAAECCVCGTTVHREGPPCVRCAVWLAPPALAASVSRRSQVRRLLVALAAVAALGAALPLANRQASHLLALTAPGPAGASAPDQRRLELFVRPEIDALRVRNYGGRTLTCAISVSGGASVRGVHIGPGRAEFISYGRFEGLDPGEGYSRAGHSVRVECMDPNGALASSVYGGHRGERTARAHSRQVGRP